MAVAVRGLVAVGAGVAAAAGAEPMSYTAVLDVAGRAGGPGVRPESATRSRAWLISKRADFWIVSAGGASLLILLAVVLLWHGDRELDTADLLLSELHLGATYDAIVRRGLWRRMPLDVLAMPLAIMIATYALVLNGWPLLVTTTVLYLGAWHRGRQNLGIARYYQRQVGGPVSRGHRWLLNAAFHLPMIAAVGYYTSTAPTHEGADFHHLALGPGILWGLGLLAAASVLIYLASTLGRMAAIGDGQRTSNERAGPGIHPAERWLVLANAVAFGSAYVVGAWSMSFILILAVHHEVQYLYFTYAVARRGEAQLRHGLLPELRRLARFAVWPAIGLASWAACMYIGSEALLPFLTAGLLSHYWLDGRIWTARARRLAVG